MRPLENNEGHQIKNHILFVTCAEYNRPYCEMLTYKPLTKNAAQEIELRRYLLNKLK